MVSYLQFLVKSGNGAKCVWRPWTARNCFQKMILKIFFYFPLKYKSNGVWIDANSIRFGKKCVQNVLDIGQFLPFLDFWRLWRLTPLSHAKNFLNFFFKFLKNSFFKDESIGAGSQFVALVFPEKNVSIFQAGLFWWHKHENFFTS